MDHLFNRLWWEMSLSMCMRMKVDFYWQHMPKLVQPVSYSNDQCGKTCSYLQQWHEPYTNNCLSYFLISFWFYLYYIYYNIYIIYCITLGNGCYLFNITSGQDYIYNSITQWLIKANRYSVGLPECPHCSNPVKKSLYE